MVRYRHLAGVALLLAVAACNGPGGTVTPPAQTDDLRIEYDLDYTTSQPLEGEMATFIVRVYNIGSYYVILRDLQQTGLGTAATWQSSFPGELSDKGNNELLYDPRPRSASTPEVFNTSLIVPTEQIIFKPRIRLLDLPREFSINYYAYSSDDVKTNIYFLKDKAERPMRFRKILDPKDLENALLPDPTVDVGSHRTVLFPYARSVLVTPKRLVFKLTVALQKRTFTADDALARLGATREDLREKSFYAGFNMWALRTVNGTFLVGSQSTVAIPPVDRLEMFTHALDSVPDAIYFDLHAGIAQALPTELPQYRIVVSQDDKGRNRYTTWVGKADLAKFLEEMRKRNFKIQVSPAPSGFRLFLTH